MRDSSAQGSDKEETNPEVKGVYSIFMYHTDDMKSVTLTFASDESFTPEDFLACVMELVDEHIESPKKLFENSKPLVKN